MPDAGGRARASAPPPDGDPSSPERKRQRNTAPRFLLVRLDGLGDALACVPMLEGLHRAHPAATFGAVCSPANAAVFSQRVSPVHVLARARDPSSLTADLVEQHYTHAIVATEEVAGYELARASHASRRSGVWHRFEKPFKSLWQFARLTDRIYRPARWHARPEHEVESLYRLAIPFGAVPPPPTDAANLRQWLRIEPARAAQGTTMGFQIARKLTSDDWGPSALAAAFAAAFSASGLDDAALLAAASDEGLARSVLEHMPAGMRARARFVPPGSVPQWFGAIERCDVLVTPDTGAAHAAGMLGVPVVDLFDGARFDQLSAQWRPWAAPQRCLVKPALRARDPLAFGDEIARAARELLAQGVRA